MNETHHIRDRRLVRNQYGLMLVAGLLLAALLFALAAVQDTFPGDAAALVALQGLRTGWLDGSTILITRSADPPVAFAVVTGAVVVFMAWRRWTAAGMSAFTLVPILCNYLLKELAARPRPEYAIMGLDPTSFSFPSGHAVFAAYFGGCLIYLAEGLIDNSGLRRGIQLLLALWALAVGVSRVYLGVHWPSDVAGGFILGGLALLIVIGMKQCLEIRLSRRMLHARKGRCEKCPP